MISMAELNPHNHVPNPEQAQNLAILLDRMNAVRAAYGKLMTITSGLRTLEEQVKIDTAGGRKPRAGSMHIRGAACDVWDRDKHLWGWCMDNLALLEQLGLYLEDKRSTPTWVHFQIIAPHSGHRIFIP